MTTTRRSRKRTAKTTRTTSTKMTTSLMDIAVEHQQAERQENELLKAAYARLEATGRKCDGCGTHIGRWTDKCYYDPVFQRAYGNVCGCAVQFTKAPFCSGCGAKLNPFQTERVVEIPRAGGYDRFGPCCAVGLVEKKESEAAESSAVSGKREERAMKALPRASIVLGSEEPELTEAEMREAEEGPYRVIEVSADWYQVALTLPEGKKFVRSAVPSKVRATRLCAKFNRG